MKNSQKRSLKILASMALTVTLCWTAGSGTAKANAVLSNDDCIKCHAAAPQTIDSKGGKHKTDVSCMDCHQGHPPTTADIIPQCNMCHEGEPHFALENCLGCHRDPHAPLDIKLAEGITDACLTCHTDQYDQLQKHPSLHTELSCSECHNAHGLIPNCMQCHEPHIDNQQMAECLACHKVHMPADVAYAEDIPSTQCAACHDTAYDLLVNSQVKHADLACATCHQDTHKMIPKCEDCHGVPHPAGLLAKFPTCGDCHGIAHNLNR